MAEIDCIIVGDFPESGTKCSFISSVPVTPSSIEKLFPFEGKYHFRVKVDGGKLGLTEKYVWIDLISNDVKEIDYIRGQNLVEIQALIVDLPEDYVEDVEYREYLETVNQEMGLNPSERPHRGSLDDKYSSGKGFLHKLTKGVKKRTVAAATTLAGGPISVQSVTQGATNIWNKFVSKASEISNNITSGGASLNNEAENNLQALASDLLSGYNDSNPRHSQLLRDTWAALQFGENFERVSEKWKEAGFQKPDPIADLKTSGVLALRGLIYLGDKYPDRCKAMLQKNKANIKVNYPFAIVGINITLLLGELFNLRDQKYLSNSFNNMFTDPDAYFEIFCIAFLHVDSIWTNRNAVRGDFGKIIGEAKSLVSNVIRRNPRNMHEFKSIAVDEGMLVPGF